MSGWFTAANDEAVDLGTSPNLPGTNDELFLDAWVWVASNGDQRIIDKSAGTALGSIDWQLAVGEAPSTNNPRVQFRLSGTSLKGDTDFSLNAWHHIAGGYDGSDMSVYLDGAFDGSVSKSGNVPNSTRNVRLGSVGNDSTNRNFDGAMFKVRVFNRTFVSATIPGTIWAMRGRDNLCDDLFYQFKFTEGAPGVSIGASSIVNSGNQTLANGSGEGSGGNLPLWHEQDLMG